MALHTSTPMMHAPLTLAVSEKIPLPSDPHDHNPQPRHSQQRPLLEPQPLQGLRRVPPMQALPQPSIPPGKPAPEPLGLPLLLVPAPRPPRPPQRSASYSCAPAVRGLHGVPSGVRRQEGGPVRRRREPLPLSLDRRQVQNAPARRVREGPHSLGSEEPQEQVSPKTYVRHMRYPAFSNMPQRGPPARTGGWPCQPSHPPLQPLLCVRPVQVSRGPGPG